MSAENVLIDTTPEAILVAGTYRFHATKEWVPSPAPPYLPFNAYFELPVPVPEDTKVNETLAIVLAPELSYLGSVIKGEVVGVYPDLPMIPGAKFAAVRFKLSGVSKVEFEVTIRYQQPIIRRGEKLFAYYIPLLPNHESYKLEYNLKDSAYVVSFEALLGSKMKLLTPHAKVLQSSPKLVSVQALHREVLEVEILPSQNSR